MTRRLFLWMCVATSSSKTKRLKGLLSTFLTLAAVVGIAPALGANHVSELSPDDVLESSKEQSPGGLSRRRGAFNYAIDLLAEASLSHPCLADYYHSLSSRLEGCETPGTANSGIEVTKPDPATSARHDGVTSDGRTATAAKAVLTILADFLDLGRMPAMPRPLVVLSLVDLGWGARRPPDPPPPGRLAAGDLSIELNPAIEYWMNYYSETAAGRQAMAVGIERSSAYIEMARSEFRQAGVPEDLVWLAFVESVWNPKAVSPAAAGGIWQFIRPTATDYGLKVEIGADERTDPLKQTKVAATYLRDLHTIFGDWALAMAAYNSGEPRVMGAIVKNGRANFWELCEKQLLPKETRDYVPKILAAIKIVSRAQDCGLVAASRGDGATGP